MKILNIKTMTILSKTKVKILTALLLTLFFSCNNDDEPTPHIDLAVDSFDLSVVKTTDFAGVVTIKGIIKNVGDDYSSSEGQQIAILYRRNLGVTNNLGTEVARKDFTTLSSNQTLAVSYSTSWSSSVEFPQEFILVISYDPDLYIDGNLQNDDTNHDNDKLILSGYDIHDLF